MRILIPAEGSAEQSCIAAVRPQRTLRVKITGKFLRLGDEAWVLKGLTYGPFAPNSNGVFLPSHGRMIQDLRHMQLLGANCLRLYHVPNREFLDHAVNAGLRVFIDVPWDKHRCFLEDWDARQTAIAKVRKTARELGTHPAVFAISVANEVPKDVVRFYGAKRVERFLERLLDAAKQEAPDCLVTYTNYPSTEFLVPTSQDFHCYNVYLEDDEVLGRYLDHLQHVAGPLPVVLGEHGIDSLRNGAERQAEVLRRHVRKVFSQGLAGSFVFSYTDDWYTGGHPIHDWAFGVTDRERHEKPAAAALRDAWRDAASAGDAEMPMVSVVVCTYNGAKTLRECLESLTRLEYPRYEVILVDDGSTDATPQIAAAFPIVRYLRQDNQGLSAARNAGAAAAHGEIVAYTDDDCLAHEAWLAFLVRAMKKQKVDAIGGPNFPPQSDCWIAKCVAASPGGPSHVMLDDRRAEHVPGCNMAFRRDQLLALGGFDRQFRVAGDDVDICWRFMDAGMSIGYSTSAVVWHHRRTSVAAYLRQQRGYGRSEAMLRFKHPRRFTALGCSRWRGVIYGEGSVGLPVCEPIVFHGRFGSGLFQSVYRSNDYSAWGYFTLLEWHAVGALIATFALFFPWLAWISLTMWGATVAAGVRSAVRAPLPQNAPRWCRPLVFLLYLLQPVVRSWQRYHRRLRGKRLPGAPCLTRVMRAYVKPISMSVQDLYWESKEWRGREAFLDALQEHAQRDGWQGNFDDEWTTQDAELLADAWHTVRIHTATEELGQGKRFTRVRCSLRASVLSIATSAIATTWVALAVASGQRWAIAGTSLLVLLLATRILRSRQQCRSAVPRLIWRAGRAAKLRPVPIVRRWRGASRNEGAGTPELQVCVH